MKYTREACYCVVAVLLIAVVPWTGSYFTGVVSEVLIYGIFAMSLGLLIGYTGMMSFGHAAFFGIAAYTVAILGVQFGWSGWIGLPIAVAVSGAAAALVGLFCVRVSGIPFLMLTMAFSQLFYSISLQWRTVTGGSDGLSGFERPTLFGLSLDSGNSLYYLILVSFGMVVLLLMKLVRSPLGSIFVGIRDNESRMRAIGYPVRWFKLVSFTIAGMIAGFAGGLYAFFNTYVSSDILHWSLSGDVVVMAVLGGVQTILGPAIGAGIFLILKNLVSSHTAYWMFWIGVVFIATVMFMREGLWGFAARTIERLSGKQG